MKDFSFDKLMEGIRIRSGKVQTRKPIYTIDYSYFTRQVADKSQVYNNNGFHPIRPV